MDDSGNEKRVPAEILLPEGKKAFVLSLDDLSYYYAYDNYGYVARLILILKQMLGGCALKQTTTRV